MLFVDEMPLAGTNKIDKRVLAKQSQLEKYKNESSLSSVNMVDRTASSSKPASPIRRRARATSSSR